MHTTPDLCVCTWQQKWSAWRNLRAVSVGQHDYIAMHDAQAALEGTTPAFS